MTLSNEQLGVGTPSVSSSNASTDGAIHPQMFASLMREADSLPEPTPEEVAEADRIINKAMAPYVELDLYMRERELRKEVLSEHISPHLLDLTKPAPIIKPIIEQSGSGGTHPCQGAESSGVYWGLLGALTAFAYWGARRECKMQNAKCKKH